MILGLQVIALIFVLIMLYFTYLHFRRRELNTLEVLIMSIAWGGAILIIIVPDFFSFFSRTIAISRAFDLAVIGGFIFVIPLVYLSYIRTRRLEKKVEQFVREEVLKTAKNIKLSRAKSIDLTFSSDQNEQRQNYLKGRSNVKTNKRKLA